VSWFDSFIFPPSVAVLGALGRKAGSVPPVMLLTSGSPGREGPGWAAGFVRGSDLGVTEQLCLSIGARQGSRASVLLPGPRQIPPKGKNPRHSVGYSRCKPRCDAGFTPRRAARHPSCCLQHPPSRTPSPSPAAACQSRSCLPELPAPVPAGRATDRTVGTSLPRATAGASAQRRRPNYGRCSEEIGTEKPSASSCSP